MPGTLAERIGVLEKSALQVRMIFIVSIKVKSIKESNNLYIMDQSLNAKD